MTDQGKAPAAATGGAGNGTNEQTGQFDYNQSQVPNQDPIIKIDPRRVGINPAELQECLDRNPGLSQQEAVRLILESRETVQEQPPPNQLTGLAALRWLEAQGGRFCKVAEYNATWTKSPGKAAFPKGWQTTPLDFEAILPHVTSGGNVGLLCGALSNNLGLLDADENFSGLNSKVPDLAQGPAIVRDGPDKGKFIIRITGDMPPAKKWKHASTDKHPFFEWLSTGNQGVIPPSKHPENGLPYRIIRADKPIPTLTPEQLSAYCLIWAGSGLDLPTPPAAQTKPARTTQPAAQPTTQAQADGVTPNFAACVLRKLIDCQSVNGYMDRLNNDYAELAGAILATPPNPTQRAAAFEAAITGRQDAATIREAVFAAPLDGDLDELLPQPPPDPGAVDIPELPQAARLAPTIGANACPWLDAYVAFSRKWSPRAYDGFHIACALWLLSTVAARRVCVHMGKERFTNLYIALTARTSLFAKSTTAEIALQTLQRAGLDWLLAADSATPQKFVADLAIKQIENYDTLDLTQQERARLRGGLAGQRGWYYDEFGQHVAAMMRDGGFMADFLGLLRRMDDTPPHYEYGSIGRGSDIIERPYLALLANMTPDCLKPFARRGANLWGDGFLARFALITPPVGQRLRDRFPSGERLIPGELLTPLVNWHTRLGLPAVSLQDVKNQKGDITGAKRIEITPNVIIPLDIPPDTYEAYYAYDEGLLDILERSDNHDLDGNYARMSEKALRVATLLASLDNQGAVTLPYWARAQAITEEWRAGLHNLYNQINQAGLSEEGENEEKILSLITRLKEPTRRELKQFSNLSYSALDPIISDLIRAGEIEKTTTGKTERYALSKTSVVT